MQKPRRAFTLMMDVKTALRRAATTCFGLRGAMRRGIAGKL
jgi:hypothetical protein